MKLTKKDLDMLDTTSFYSKAQHRAVCEQAVKECYEYKCLEEELGVDLITLLKALKEGIKAHREGYDETMLPSLCYEDGNFFLEDCDSWVSTKTYGKAWELAEGDEK